MAEEISNHHIVAALKLGIAAVQRGDYASALPVFTALYQSIPPEKAPEGLSYFALCVAKVEHKGKRAIDLCRQAIDLHPGDGRHHANLVRLYIILKSRKSAIDTLEEGLRRMPKDEMLIAVREEIGYRKLPSLSWLSRTHPLNKAYGELSNSLSGATGYFFFIVAVILMGWVFTKVFFLILK